MSEDGESFNFNCPFLSNSDSRKLILLDTFNNRTSDPHPFENYESVKSNFFYILKLTYILRLDDCTY